MAKTLSVDCSLELIRLAHPNRGSVYWRAAGVVLYFRRCDDLTLANPIDSSVNSISTCRFFLLFFQIYFPLRDSGG
jgi:hypothetical protein